MKRVLAVGLLGFSLAAGTALASVEDEIRERIKPVGELCLQGDECGQAVAASASSGPRSGSEVYEASCTACHATGAAGAPVVGNADAWAPRIDKGLETLFEHALNGFNAMPPKGGCASCADEEITAAVEHMVESSQ
ncbi:MAG: cytochrome c5 family protein [Gammaproteobacteria bacterium]|uniref:Cytochrome c5 n=1 Tax=Marinobacter litoralis TaxID=187981 RepID=A0A3M2RBH9_9GAMM|nr:cytochrome c5 family protein [Marinobacter litoralis]MBR9869929.1 cytochrome c5 family protein [Gammaproteobacteria bacterium]RMJ02633.1 Cytochrome c5 [Marinobacter litoralis]